MNGEGGVQTLADPSPSLLSPQPGKTALRLEPRRLEPILHQGTGPAHNSPAPSWRRDPARGGRTHLSPDSHPCRDRGAPGAGGEGELPRNTYPARRGCFEDAGF